jgi:DNA-binding transcriptional LysR family regulator
MDRLDEISVFLAILEAGSLSGAARQLRRSAPSVARALLSLERRLDAQLVERTTRRLQLTETGRQFEAEARYALAAYHDAFRQSGETIPRGVLRLTAPRVFGLRHVMPVLTGFLDRFPTMSAELSLADQYLDLRQEGLDVAVRIGRGMEGQPSAHRFGEVRRVVVASPAYLAGHGEPRAPTDLTGHTVVHISAAGSLLEWRFRTGRQEKVVRLSPRLTVNDIEAALVAVCAGHGIARVLSYQVAEELLSGTLVRLLRAYEPAALPVSLVTASMNPPARVRAFLDYATPILSALLDRTRAEPGRANDPERNASGPPEQQGMGLTHPARSPGANSAPVSSAATSSATQS